MPAVQTNVPAKGGTPKNGIPIRFLKRSFNAAIALVFFSSSLMLFFFRLAGCACNPARRAPMSGGSRPAPGRGEGIGLHKLCAEGWGHHSARARPVLDGRGRHVLPFP